MLLILLVFNLDLVPAKANGEGDVFVAPLLDDEKPDEQTPKRDFSDFIDLSQPEIGSDSWNDPASILPEVSVPMPPNAITNPDDPKAPRTTPLIPAPPGGDGSDGLPRTETGTAPPLGPLGPLGPGAGTFASRSGQNKEDNLRRDGGNKESEAMVARGLQFLVNHQAPDGHWSMHEFDRHARKLVKKGNVEGYEYARDKSDPQTQRNNDTAGTAFGLLPFLAAGHTQNPVKDSKFDYSKSVKLGLNYLMKKQDREGYFGGDMYAHPLATIAMCEAYGLTADNALKASAQRAIQYIENAQDPIGGGWRYGPKQPGDTSVTGWMLMALKSGQMSGLTVKAETLKKVEKYLDSCESANKGGYGYTPAGGETISMTAVGLLCRQYLGVTPRNPALLAGVQRLEKNLPSTNGNIYYLYYATQVMHHMGGDNWDQWNKGPGGDGKGGMRDTLIAAMDKGTTNPDTEGSWLLTGADGRLMSTSLALLTLEVYYRHLPLYRRDVGAVKGAQ